jgi:ActD protein
MHNDGQTNEPEIYGLMAEFSSPETLVAAAKRVHEAGYRNMDAYSPFPIHGLAEALGVTKTRVPFFVLVGGLCGAGLAFLMQFFASVLHYPYAIGGRPFNSWPAFIPITFEGMILIAAFSAVISMIVLNGLPLPYHAVFNVDGFERASSSSFFLCIESADPKFDAVETRTLLASLQPIGVSEVDH